MFQLGVHGVCKYGLDCRFLHEENLDDPEEVENETTMGGSGKTTPQKEVKTIGNIDDNDDNEDSVDELGAAE